MKTILELAKECGQDWIVDDASGKLKELPSLNAALSYVASTDELAGIEVIDEQRIIYVRYFNLNDDGE